MGIFDVALGMATASSKNERRTIGLNTVAIGGVGLGDLANGIEGLIDIFKNPKAHVPLPMLGGLTLTEYRDLYHKAKQSYAKKQFYRVVIADFAIPPNFGLEKVDDVFNFLAVDVSYSSTITSESVQVGPFQSDKPTGKERKQIRVTFLDRHDGIIERFFKHKQNSVFNKDGTQNPPSDYFMAISIHKINPETGKSYIKDTYGVRVETMDFDLSRRDLGNIEIPVTFTELDEYMR